MKKMLSLWYVRWLWSWVQHWDAWHLIRQDFTNTSVNFPTPTSVFLTHKLKMSSFRVLSQKIADGTSKAAGCFHRWWLFHAPNVPWDCQWNRRKLWAISFCCKRGSHVICLLQTLQRKGSSLPQRYTTDWKHLNEIKWNFMDELRSKVGERFL